MTYTQYVSLYLITVPLVALLDLLWLGFLAKDFYQTKLAYILGPIQWPAAIIFYFMYAAGIVFFAVAPALPTGSFIKVVAIGCLLGFFAYATYDLTNWATIKDWPVRVVIVDILWGTFLTGSVAAISYCIGKHFIL